MLGALLSPTLKNYSQTIDKEKSFELDRKSQKGYLGDVEITEEGNYVLYYVTKNTDKKFKVNIFSFDKDFGFLGKEEYEEELERMRAKFSWFKYKGDEYYFDGITTGGVFNFALVLKKKRTTYKWDWYNGGYYKTVSLLDKVKPRSADGDKFYPIASFEDDVTGGLVIVAGEGAKLSDELRFKKYHILEFDFDLNTVSDEVFEFDYPHQLIHSKGIGIEDSENPGNYTIGGGVLVFAPISSKDQSYEGDKLTYIQFDKSEKVVARETFKVPNAHWTIIGSEIVFNDENEISEFYMYGTTREGSSPYPDVNPLKELKLKPKGYQIMKVKESKVDYVTETSYDEILSAKIVPAGTKKTKGVTAKCNFKPIIYPLSNGQVVLAGNTTDLKKGTQLDFAVLQFDQKGKIIANFSKTRVNSKCQIANQDIIEGESGLFLETSEADLKTGFKYVVLNKLDANSKNFGPNTIPGREGKKQVYYLNGYPVLNKNSREVVYFMRDTKEKNIFFSRIKL